MAASPAPARVEREVEPAPPAARPSLPLVPRLLPAAGMTAGAAGATGAAGASGAGAAGAAPMNAAPALLSSPAMLPTLVHALPRSPGQPTLAASIKPIIPAAPEHVPSAAPRATLSSTAPLWPQPAAARVEIAQSTAAAPAAAAGPPVTQTLPRPVPPQTVTRAEIPTIKPPVPPAPSRWRTALRWTAIGLKILIISLVVWFASMLGLIGLYRHVDPPASVLMLTQRLSGQELQHQWVPLSRVSGNLRRAVLTSEDAKFCQHWGFDLGEIRAAMRAGDGFGRGASTITQQTAKNLFLWPGKSYVRKALEVPLTFAIEALWPKARILEVYLNIAEWGPGVFGAEAAAQYHYGKPALDLNEREAALLAVTLPNPITRDAADPAPALARRASTIQARMRAVGTAVSHCLPQQRGRPL